MKRALACCLAFAGCSSTPTQPIADAGVSDVLAQDVSSQDGSPNNLDQYGPWFGGYQDPTFFPISVWLQDPSIASQYAAIGVNQYIGLYDGPTSNDLTTLTSASMPAYCDQNATALASLTNKIMLGWTQEDEPDNAQPVDGGYGPCVAPSEIQSLYQTMKSNDPTRPVFLNVGQGIANDAWVGRGSCSNQPGDYAEYAKGADIVSFDIYPINSGLDITLVALGVDRWNTDVANSKPVWNWIETTLISSGGTKPTPDQTKSEVWMSIIHGSMGIGYFCHHFTPGPEDDHALLDDTAMSAMVKSVDQQIKDLAPALNTAPITNAVTESSSSKVDFLVKRQGGTLYVLAVSMTATTTTATFTFTHDALKSANVLGEARQIPVASASFQDSFDGYAVHLYAIQ
jgi:hypothetical protein